MRKWIQLIITLLVLALFCLPLTTVPMDRIVEPEPTPVPESAVLTDEQTDGENASADEDDASEAQATKKPTKKATKKPAKKSTKKPTAKPTREPDPTPVPDLPSVLPVNNGDRDAEGKTDIADIQKRLIELNYLFANPTGLFGDASTEAIRAFQAANGLPEYGIVDEETYYAMYAPNVIAAPEPTPTPMAFGASGEEVTEVQRKLAQWGFLAFMPDGSFGKGTRTGVENFQMYLYNYGPTYADAAAPTLLGVDETPTPEPTAEPTPEPTTEPTPTPKPTPVPELPSILPLTLGSRDTAEEKAVSAVQQRLIDLGYLNDTVDGAFGANSAAAVKRFQTAMGMNATGIVDGETYYAIFSHIAAQPTPTVVPTPTPYAPSGIVDDELLDFVRNGRFDVYRQDVHPGDENVEAFRVQRRLACLDYLYTTDCDGAFGSVSELALKYFQRCNRLPETGIADEETQLVLFSEQAIGSDYVVHAYKTTVDVSDQRVYIYEWTGDRYTSDPVQTFICSTGTKKNPTPLGTYSADGRATTDQWYYFKEFKCYAQYAYRIFGGILFHSVTYNEPRESTLHKGALAKLGERASHGCIRLKVADAKWIFENCPPGMTVTIQE